MLKQQKLLKQYMDLYGVSIIYVELFITKNSFVKNIY